MEPRPLVVDANILVSAVLGNRIQELINSYLSTTNYWIPQHALDEARARLAAVSVKRQISESSLHLALGIIVSTGSTFSCRNTAIVSDAKRRMWRDPSDWPILAAALELDYPIWTDDQDFFGCGVATWSTRNVEIYSSAASQ